MLYDQPRLLVPATGVGPFLMIDGRNELQPTVPRCPEPLGRALPSQGTAEPIIRYAGPAIVLAIAAGVGGVIGIASTFSGVGVHPTYDDVVTGCTVNDGDTIRCNGERVRLLGIDAPELPGHCRSGRDCAPGDRYASTAGLGDALTGTIHIERLAKITTGAP